MENSDGFLSKSKKIQKTKIWPLRVIGNLCGGFAGNHLFKSLILDEDKNYGLRYKYHARCWKYLNKPYEWWGTYYMVDMEMWKKDLDQMNLDMSGDGWDDLDEFGKAYWDKDK
jgi:hypothetical protein